MVSGMEADLARDTSVDFDDADDLGQMPRISEGYDRRR